MDLVEPIPDMGQPTIDNSKQKEQLEQAVHAESGLLECCRQTIDMHAANNPMMVCSSCKQIIKCFSEERAYNNYQRFCASRHRRILATAYNANFVVVFRSYDTYST